MSTPIETTTQILKAGGLVPLGAKVGKDDAVDTVVARAYGHPILGARVVIRLTAENVTQGDDLEMATLGFGAGEHRGKVAKERRRPLGFPGWALVHDPKNARFALDVVEELKKQARKAKSKPGHAKDGIDAIAGKLAKSVPHFLPSFYEEAGRAFIEHGAIAQAAIMFGKAREAEAVHALDIDEAARVDGFLEFALAGAVTTKALTQYAKDLAAGHEPKIAYTHFRQLCLQRTLGGMPPWSGMATELRRLCKAAKLDGKTEDAAFVAEIIESPALGKAAGDFWRAYAEPIIALGKASAKIRGLLLNLFPTGSSYKPDLDEAWLDLLDATGALGALETLAPDDVPEEARPLGGAAAWFDKLTRHLARDYRAKLLGPRAFALLRRIAPRLVLDGKPITAGARGGYEIDLDLAELALSLGATLARPKHGQIHVGVWADKVDAPERGCDPVRVAAHPTYGPVLSASVGQTLGKEPFESASRGKLGFVAAKRAFVEDVLSKADRAGLPGLEDAVATVQAKVTSGVFAELPDLYARFASLTVIPALARTLRIGLVDELGWPALEAVAAEIDPDGSVPWTVHGGLPAIVIATTTKLVAVGPTGTLGEHDLVVPPKHELVTARFIDGAFLVLLKEGYSTIRAYWSDAANDLFDTQLSAYSLTTLARHAVTLPDGAWLESGTPIRRGDRAIVLGGIAAHDGTTTWVTDYANGVHRWVEISATGERGRASWPSFIEARQLTDDDGTWKLHVGNSYLLPAPAGVSSSPMGLAEGRIGQRVRVREGAPPDTVVERIDGVSCRAPHGGITALVTLPGEALRPLDEETAWREGITTTLLDGEAKTRGSVISNKERRYAKGQAVPLSSVFWHLYTARDVAGSQRLHAVTEADARTLVAAIPVAPTQPPGVVYPLPADVLAGLLPEVTHPRLRLGLEGVTALAANLALRITALAADRAPGATKPQVHVETGPSDDVLFAPLVAWAGRSWGYDGSAWSQLDATIRVFADADRSDRVLPVSATSRIDWYSLAQQPWALAFIATALGTPAKARGALVDLLAKLTALPSSTHLRTFAANGTIDGDTHERGHFELRWRGGNAYAIRKQGYYNYLNVLEYAPDGTFRDLPGLAPLAIARGGGSRPTDDEIAALREAVASGNTSWRDDAGLRIAEATGLTLSEATYLWAGLPNASDGGNHFLDKALREQLGLKATQAAMARDLMNALPVAKRLAVAEATGRAGAAALLDGRAIDACIAAWIDQVGKRVAISEALIADAEELQSGVKPADALGIYASGGDDPRLTVDSVFALAEGGGSIRVAKAEPLVGQPPLAEPPPAFDLTIVSMHAAYAPFLYATLPVGDPLRARVPQVHARVQERLRNPHLWFDAGNTYELPRVGPVLEALGGASVPGLTDGLTAQRLGPVIVVRSQHRAELRINAGGLDEKHAATAESLVTLISPHYRGVYDVVRYMASPDLAALVARIASTPVAAGGWEQDPRASASEIVDAVAKHYKLSRDAAALYLQYLVLIEPTAKNLALWNACKPKQLDAPHAELVARDLLVEAKRERAGRGYFLQGGWEALKSPHPPLETWKLPFYATRLPNRFVATAPFHVLFERAWARLQSGDVPRYEEVKR